MKKRRPRSPKALARWKRGSKFAHKKRSSVRDKRGKIINGSTKCVDCGKNTGNHHLYCDKCHRRLNAKRNRIANSKKNKS